MVKSILPFGLIFEEKSEGQHPLGQPEYNYQSAVSMVETTNGVLPFVTWEWLTLGATNTGTNTKQQADAEDEDIGSQRTQTVTETVEHTDRD